MAGLILPASYDNRSAIARGEDVADITRSVQDGDPTLGWRGDPQMDVYREGSVVKVYGFDLKGERYCAATVNLVDSDWRTTLIRKLRDGDWQTGTLFDSIEKDRARLEKEKQQASDELVAEEADKYVTKALRARGSRRHF